MTLWAGRAFHRTYTYVARFVAKLMGDPGHLRYFSVCVLRFLNMSYV